MMGQSGRTFSSEPLRPTIERKMRDTRVYMYGLPRLVEGHAAVSEQIQAAHRYYNALIALERGRREQITAAQRALDTGGLEAQVAQAVAAVDEVRAALVYANVEKRARPDLTAELRLARAHVKHARRVWRDARRAMRPALQARYDQIAAQTLDAHKALRAASGVYWGTYLLVEQAVEAARKSVVPPRFRSWAHGAGRLGVQCQRGLAVTDLLVGTDTRLQIAPVPATDRSVSRRHDPARGIGRTILRLRVESTSERAPVWAVWTLVLHRPLPDDGAIKQATVVRRVTPGASGPGRFRDELHLTIEAAQEPDRRAMPDRDRVETVAVDIGWRRLDDGGLRVATWKDDRGSTGTFVLAPSDCEGSLTHAASLRGIRDRNLNALRTRLVAWMHRGPVLPWPATWDPQRLVLERWRSPYRFAALWAWWRARRFAGDDEGFRLIDHWWTGDGVLHHGDRHLWTWEANERQTALRRRRECYRCWAAELTRRYRIIVIEQFDLRPLASRPEVDEAAIPLETAARANRVVVAIDTLRQALLIAAPRRGVQIVAVPAMNTTRTCHVCGSVESWDQAREVAHTCAVCGTTWDQDVCAAVNLLRLWRERPSEATILVAARGPAESQTYAAITGGRWGRRKASKQDRSQSGSDLSAGT